MHVVVLTGGLGSGKSLAAEYFRSRGAVTLDLDEIAARSLTPGSPTLVAVVEAFGPGVLRDDGSLDRAALAGLAFATPEATALLDSIVHPAVIREVGPAIAELRLLPNPPEVVALEVPLLVEAPVYAELADLVIAFEAPEAVRVERAVLRGMGEQDAWHRVRRQATDTERASLADVVIVNDGTPEALLAALERLWEERVSASGVAPADAGEL